jgi:hypothetical protein
VSSPSRTTERTGSAATAATIASASSSSLALAIKTPRRCVGLLEDIGDRLAQVVLVGSSHRSHEKNVGTKPVHFKALALVGEKIVKESGLFVRTQTRYGTHTGRRARRHIMRRVRTPATMLLCRLRSSRKTPDRTKRELKKVGRHAGRAKRPWGKQSKAACWGEAASRAGGEEIASTH